MSEWRPSETDRLRAFFYSTMEHGLPVSHVDYVIAEKLGRSEASVRSKRRRMGLVDDGGQKSSEAEPESLVDASLDDLVGDYVTLGGNLTRRELARKYGLSLNEVRSILRANNITKSSLPFSPGTIANEDEDELVDRALLEKERRVAAKIEQRQVIKLQSEYRRLLKERESQERFKAAGVELAAAMPKPTYFTGPAKNPNEGDQWHAHVPTTDEHVGSLVWSPECFGDDYDLDIACRRLRRHAELAAEWIYNQPGECYTVHRTFVGDLFHSLLGTTEHGTALDQDTRAAKIWIELMEALRYSIMLLTEVAAIVDVRGVRGNHDGAFEFFAAMYTLQESFKDADNVNVTVTPGRYDSFLVQGREGSALHVLDHGYGQGSVGAWKTQAQASDVARTFPGYPGCDRVYTYMGHLHQHEVATHGDHEIIRLPSFCETDEYETSLRYYGEPAAHLFRLDINGRIESVRRIYRDDLEGL